MKEQFTIQVTVNGEHHQLAESSRVIDLIDILGLAPERLAIELNSDILPRTVWEKTKLQDGDKLEIVHFVGGGKI